MYSMIYSVLLCLFSNLNCAIHIANFTVQACLFSLCQHHVAYIADYVLFCYFVLSFPPCRWKLGEGGGGRCGGTDLIGYTCILQCWPHTVMIRPLSCCGHVTQPQLYD
jgi:hypothetical protein